MRKVGKARSFKGSFLGIRKPVTLISVASCILRRFILLEMFTYPYGKIKCFRQGPAVRTDMSIDHNIIPLQGYMIYDMRCNKINVDESYN